MCLVKCVYGTLRTRTATRLKEKIWVKPPEWFKALLNINMQEISSRCALHGSNTSQKHEAYTQCVCGTCSPCPPSSETSFCHVICLCLVSLWTVRKHSLPKELSARIVTFFHPVFLSISINLPQCDCFIGQNSDNGMFFSSVHEILRVLINEKFLKNEGCCIPQER